jgi:hypothetical protein
MFINLCQGPLEYTPLSIPARAIKSKRVHTPPQVQAEADECLLYCTVPVRRLTLLCTWYGYYRAVGDLPALVVSINFRWWCLCMAE